MQAPLRSPLHGYSHVLPSPCRSLERHRSRTSKRMSRRYAFVCRRRIWPRANKLTRGVAGQSAWIDLTGRGSLFLRPEFRTNAEVPRAFVPNPLSLTIRSLPLTPTHSVGNY